MKTKPSITRIVAGLAGLALIAAPLIVRAAPAPGSPAPLAGSWAVDPVHTTINFGIRHLGLSTVHGRFDTVSGTIVADPAHLANSSIAFTIDATSINTDNSMRDGDIKSANYFDVATYPTITFQSTKVVKRGTGASVSYIAFGNLTMHGVTKSIALPFTLDGPIYDPWGSPRFGVTSGIVLKRSDYGIGAANTLTNGSFAIGDDVTVDISLEAVPPKQ